MKKYELTEEKINVLGCTLYRIRALKDVETATGFTVKSGELGGYIEKESNLSHAGNAWVDGNAWVGGNARISKSEHLLLVGPVGSRNDFTTFYRDKSNLIYVKCGCFNGSIDDFINKVKKTHGDNKHAKVYLKAVEMAKIQIDLGGDNKDV